MTSVWQHFVRKKNKVTFCEYARFLILIIWEEKKDNVSMWNDDATFLWTVEWNESELNSTTCSFKFEQKIVA